MIESHQKQTDSLTCLHKEAELSFTNAQKDQQNRAVKDAATHDERHQKELDDLRKQLEDRYDRHLTLMKGQYETQISQLQTQLNDLHTQFQERGASALRHTTSLGYNVDATFSPAGRMLGSTDRSASLNTAAEGEREELEKRIRQAEARSIALSQQLQSMPSSLQVI